MKIRSYHVGTGCGGKWFRGKRPSFTTFGYGQSNGGTVTITKGFAIGPLMFWKETTA